MSKSEGLFKAAHACIHKFTAKELVGPEKTLHGPTRRTSSLASNAKPREGPRVRPFSLASANNRPRGVPDRPICRSRAQIPRGKEGTKAGGSPPHLLMWHETWRQNHQIRGTSCAFPRVALSDHVCGDLAIGAGPFWVLALGPTPSTQWVGFGLRHWLVKEVLTVSCVYAFFPR